MKAAAELERWLSDPLRQRRTKASGDAFIQSWNAGDRHRRFDEALGGDGNAEQLAEAVRDLFSCDSWVGDLIDQLAGEARRDPFFEPPFPFIQSDVHTGLIAYRNDRVSIALGVSHAARLAEKKQGPRGPTSIGFTGNVAVLKFLKAGEALISLWEAPEITAEFSTHGAGRCARRGERRLADGDMLTIDGRHQGFVIEEARSNLLILQAEIVADRAPVKAEFDSETLEYVGCSAGDDAASRIQMLATLLRKLDCNEAFDAIAPFLGDPNFFVRWHVMRELLGLDAEAALPHLRRMAARDPHPDTRRAARLTLERVESLPGIGRKAA